jgi:hypothetical protein
MCPHTPSLWLKVPFLHSSFLAQLLSSVYGFALCFLLLWPTTSTMDGDDDDDEGELLSLIAVNRQCQQRSEPVVGGHIADVAALPEEADDQELLGLVALARQPAARKFENLSWQHTLHCQSAKRLKVSTKIAEQAVAKTAQVETTLAITSCMGGAGLGGRRKAKLNENQYAICQLDKPQTLHSIIGKLLLHAQLQMPSTSCSANACPNRYQGSWLLQLQECKAMMSTRFQLQRSPGA